MEYRGSACLAAGAAPRAALAALGRVGTASRHRAAAWWLAVGVGKQSEFRVSGLGRREPGAGTQVRVQVQDLSFAPYPYLCLITRTRDLRAETWDPKMRSTFAPLHRPQADLHFCTFSSPPLDTPRSARSADPTHCIARDLRPSCPPALLCPNTRYSILHTLESGILSSPSPPPWEE